MLDLPKNAVNNWNLRNQLPNKNPAQTQPGAEVLQLGLLQRSAGEDGEVVADNLGEHQAGQ